MEWITRSCGETEALGERLGRALTGGEVIAYDGDLGAGKTAFTRGLARGLGITEPVTSPTYTIVNEYLSGRLPLFHFDMYRLHSAVPSTSGWTRIHPIPTRGSSPSQEPSYADLSP